MQITFVSCTKSKLDRASKAKDLYSPSLLFRKSWNHAMKIGNPTFILSAKHGLVNPDQIIAPYDETLTKKGKKARLQWTSMVINQLEESFKLDDITEVTFLCGKAYNEFLKIYFQERGIVVKEPMEGLGIGQRLAFLTNN